MSSMSPFHAAIELWALLGQDKEPNLSPLTLLFKVRIELRSTIDLQRLHLKGHPLGFISLVTNAPVWATVIITLSSGNLIIRDSPFTSSAAYYSQVRFTIILKAKLRIFQYPYCLRLIPSWFHIKKINLQQTEINKYNLVIPLLRRFYGIMNIVFRTLEG